MEPPPRPTSLSLLLLSSMFVRVVACCVLACRCSMEPGCTPNQGVSHLGLSNPIILRSSGCFSLPCLWRLSLNENPRADDAHLACLPVLHLFRGTAAQRQQRNDFTRLSIPPSWSSSFSHKGRRTVLDKALERLFNVLSRDLGFTSATIIWLVQYNILVYHRWCPVRLVFRGSEGPHGAEFLPTTWRIWMSWACLVVVVFPGEAVTDT